MELKAGMWIAQGPETNVLILLTGKAPILEIKGAIDLNQFKSTGKVRELTKESSEVQDILMYPEKYLFLEPSISEAINTEGFKPTLEGITEITNKEEIVEDGLIYYKTIIQLCDSIDEAKTKTRLYLFRKYNITFGQASCMLTLICKKCNQPI